MKKLILASLFILVASVFSHAQVEVYQEMVKGAKQAELTMTKTYTAVLKKLKPTQKKLVIEEQNAWLKLRAARLNIWKYDTRGGSSSEAIVLEKKIGLTEERIKELEVYKESF